MEAHVKGKIEVEVILYLQGLNNRRYCTCRPPPSSRAARRVLDGLSLEIREGEHTAILGPNGAGKSSFIRLITREDYPLAATTARRPCYYSGKTCGMSLNCAPIWVSSPQTCKPTF